jgi:hypothetical protein
MSTKAVSISGILMASIYLITSFVFLCLQGSDSSGWKAWAVIGGFDLAFNLTLLSYPDFLKVYLMFAFHCVISLYQIRFQFMEETRTTEFVTERYWTGEVTLGLILIRLLIMIYGFAALNGK